MRYIDSDRYSSDATSEVTWPYDLKSRTTTDRGLVLRRNRRFAVHSDVRIGHPGKARRSSAYRRLENDTPLRRLGSSLEAGVWRSSSNALRRRFTIRCRCDGRNYFSVFTTIVPVRPQVDACRRNTIDGKENEDFYLLRLVEVIIITSSCRN